ncbi:hypothetical protein ACO2TQ_35770 [Burkholderia sp. OKR4-1]|uniref:hypothetical protein n=1 Tax=Burkholderia TaxID=32008 RepID=UPI0024C1F4B8|nr:hypothetical protein [Burkholderia contaminans]MDK0996909.1 hypothetical protein [Burkholderia contaminans]
MNPLRPNRLWIEQADVTIRRGDPTASEVIEVTRGFAVLRRDGALTARLADGTQWRIDGQYARQLTANEIAARAGLRESFQ